MSENKLYIKVPAEFFENFVSWAGRLGLTRNQLGNICLQAGLKNIIRAVSPEEALTAEQIVSIARLAGADRDAEEELKKILERSADVKRSG
jgi:hypothetical protein